MKTVAYAAVAALMMTGTASAQSAPGSDLTRMLNGTPPAAAPRATTPPATRPATAAPTATRPAAPPTTTPPRATPTPAPAARPSTTTPAAAPARATSPSASTPTTRPSATTSATRTAPPVAPAATTARPAPATPPGSVPAVAPASPPPAPPTVLNATAVAALPFTVDLPSTFQITTGRPGPNFNVYAIRKGGRSFVTVYVGPASQFPIYTGDTVQLSGRSSIVVPEDGRRRAVEHLFRRENPAQDIHAWVSSLEGADAAQAEQIAQSISPR